MSDSLCSDLIRGTRRRNLIYLSGTIFLTLEKMSHQNSSLGSGNVLGGKGRNLSVADDFL